MRLTLENVIALGVLLLTEAWFLSGYFVGKSEFEPFIAFVAALGVIFAKEPLKAKFGVGGDMRCHDQALFEEFQQALPVEPTIRLLKEPNFGDSFSGDAIQPLINFVNCWNTVDKEFLDKALEKKRKMLYKEASALSFTFTQRTAPVGRGHGYILSVFSDSDRASGLPRPPSVLEDARVLNVMASEFVPKYEAFVRTCKAKLTP
jgi:hypothetical protein